jgi:phosphoglycolate phosphatase-like HAD superfamily hydrolase
MQSNAVKRATLYDVLADVESASAALDELLYNMPRLNRYGIFHELAKRFDGIDAEVGAQAYTTLCCERILAGAEVLGAFELLKTLHDAGRVSVVNSATPEGPLRELVAQSRFSLFVSSVYGMPAGKLDNLEKAMAKAGVQARDTLVIGDGEGDRQYAEQTNCRFIAVASDNNDFDRVPEILVDRLDQLMPARTSPLRQIS